MLAGCSQNNTAEETTAAASAEITESTTTMSEATTVSVTLETTEKVAESEETESPKVIPADEVYDVYPMRIIYPEKTETNITVVEEKEINEEFKNGEFVVYKFSAAYPVFSGGDEAVTEKINGYIKNYVDSICDELEWTRRRTIPRSMILTASPIQCAVFFMNGLLTAAMAKTFYAT